MGGKKTSLIIIALALLPGLIVLGVRRDEPVAMNVSEKSRFSISTM